MAEKIAHTPGPWFVSGVRFRMNGGEWHSINRYNEELKRDENIAVVSYDPRTGAGLADARLIAAAPDLLEALKALFEDYKNLADSGDAGNWKLENLEVGKRALAAIAKAESRS